MSPRSTDNVAHAPHLRSTERDFMKVNNEFLSHVAELPPAATAAYLALVYFVRDDPEQTTQISGAKLAARACVGLSTLRRVLPLLVAHGLVTIARTMRSNRYTLLRVQSLRVETPQSLKVETLHSLKVETPVVKDLQYMKTFGEGDKNPPPHDFSESAPAAVGLTAEQVRWLFAVFPEEGDKMSHWEEGEWRDVKRRWAEVQKLAQQRLQPN